MAQDESAFLFQTAVGYLFLSSKADEPVMTPPTTEQEKHLAWRVRKQMEGYATQMQALQASNQWLDFPRAVSIETYSLCNAACTFCPYPDLERKGERMSEALFQKIVDDVAAAQGPTLPRMILHRVNEPFLDTRLFDFCRYIAHKLPDTVIDHTTNLTPLNEKNLDALLDLGNTGSLKISFNDHRPDEYQKTMALPFEKTYQHARLLHDRMAAGEVPFPVSMGRVADGTVVDLEFINWVKQEFPLFKPVVFPRMDWIGSVDVEPTNAIPQVGCGQWFELHFLADGREAFCCIDSDGKYGSGDARSQNVIDIYNAPARRQIRLHTTARKEVGVCALCTALV